MTTADDLDKEEMDQLHAVVVQISGNCFELKKLCATVLVAAGTLLATFTDKKLETSIFVGGLLIVSIFWLADGQSYYYQKKLRRSMDELRESRAGRANLGNDPADEMWISVRKPTQATALSSIFNLSMVFYGLLATAIALGWGLFLAGVIGS